MSTLAPFDALSKENKLKLTLKCYLEAAVHEGWELGYATAKDREWGTLSKFEKMHLSLEIADTLLDRRNRLLETLEDLELLNLNEAVYVEIKEEE